MNTENKTNFVRKHRSPAGTGTPGSTSDIFKGQETITTIDVEPGDNGDHSDDAYWVDAKDTFGTVRGYILFSCRQELEEFAAHLNEYLKTT